MIGRAGATGWSEMMRPPSHTLGGTEGDEYKPSDSVPGVGCGGGWSPTLCPVMTNAMTDGPGPFLKLSSFAPPCFGEMVVVGV